MSDAVDTSDKQNSGPNVKQPKVVANCDLCLTVKSSLADTIRQTGRQSGSDQMPFKDTIGNLEIIPNEMIAQILKNLSIVELSVVSTTNKWFRDFIVYHYIESNSGLNTLLGPNSKASNAITEDERQTRLKVFSDLGLLLKRLTCLYPTRKRIEILIKVFSKLDGFPKITSNPLENQTMKLIFESFGRVVQQLIAGWDDSELEGVFRSLQSITQINRELRIVLNDKPGGRQSVEYYIRSYYRMYCNLVSDDTSKSINDNSYWINRMVKGLNLKQRARLLMIVFGPLISSTPKPTTVPYIGYWDLTDTFFIHSGLEQLGFALFLLYKSSQSVNSTEMTDDIIHLFDEIIELPVNWLLENVASLLFYSGDEFTYDYLFSKVEADDYSGAAQKLVFLCLVSHKLTKSTKNVYFLIEKLASNEHKDKLYNEIIVAFNEAMADIENAFELEDEREITEVQDMLDANNDLLLNYMLRPEPKGSQSQDSSSQESKSEDCSHSSRTGHSSEE